MKKFLFFLALSIFCYQAYAQIPSNDNCINAISLAVNSDVSCTLTTAGTLEGATDSGIPSNKGTADDDVWYSFIATATSHRIKLIDLNNDTALVHEVIDGSCGSLSVLSSSNYNSSFVTGLTVGSTYFIRVFSYGSTTPEPTTFSICVCVAPDAPANDECNNAISVPVNTDTSCTLKTAGTLVSATNSNEGEPNIGTADDDVWYTFAATATSHRIRLLNINGDVTNLIYEVFEGSCGNQLISHYTSNREPNIVSGLTIGTTYYLRVFSYDDFASESTTFDLCISMPPPAPVNDECTNAITLTVNQDQSCMTTTSGTLVGATNSGYNANIGIADDDVWFKFVATATGHKIALNNIEGDMRELVHEVFDGSCELFGIMNSSYINNSSIRGLTIGNTYYVRVFTFENHPSESTTFTICVNQLPPPPANDECSGAVALSINSDSNCTSITSGTVVSATNSGIPTITGTADDDVWYSFVATATSHKIKLFKNSIDFDLVHEVMDGNCGSLAALNSTESNSSIVSGLTVGNTYYIRVFSYGSYPQDSTAFDICISILPPPPSNDNCTGAIALTVNTDATCTIKTAGTITGATDSGIPTPIGSADDDVWFTFVAPATSLGVSLQNLEGDQTHIILEILEGTCGGHLERLIENNPDSRVINGLTVGNTYYLRAYSYNEGQILSTTFDICVRTLPQPPVNDECANAITLTPTTTYAGGAVNSNVAGATNSPETIPESACGEAGADVWFKTVIPADGNLIIETGDPTTSGNSGFDSTITVYSGNCDTLEFIECNDEGDVELGYSKINLTGRTAGETIYIRVWEYVNNEFAQFSISAWSPTLGTTAFNNVDFKAYPNPVKDMLNVSYNQNISNVKIFNLLGQNMASKTINDTNGKIDMSDLPSGTYLVKITADGETKAVKVIKQ
ncbi:T9SS type A sorting domain-containing protein [uncultured Flavobacterium sp.]|uniref:T9SS type A sorting domain-containing protein n=1 Tax=uncultured Flavobacterium sp. TaxID=165435 RepID=UPI00121921AA|nr:T9SS type A sorting domain-containing protein [uncultured Flavobacterium sp.]THD31473.1 MAG: T9SS type A sorting domain-containing protein [Flavobacterium johnsoniae]